MLNLLLCYWSSQLFDLLAASSSSDVPVLLRAKLAYYLLETALRSDLRPRLHESRKKDMQFQKLVWISVHVALKQFKVAFAETSQECPCNHARSFFHLIQQFMASIFVHLQSKFYT